MTALIRTPVHEILAIEAAGEDCFVGGAREVNHIGGVYGGQLLAQGLLSAVRSVEAMPPTSLHGYFMATASVGKPIEYRVNRLRDSRRFANRQVMAIQDGQLLFTLICEFHAPEEGFAHQSAVMPDVPPPEQVPALQQFALEHEDRLDPVVVRNLSGALPMEIRAVDIGAYFLESGQHPARSFWIRLPGADAIEDPREQACLLAYVSDYGLGAASAIPHGVPTNNPDLLLTSLDHSVWFHGPVPRGEWMLHHMESPSAGDGLGFNRGLIFDRAGRLIASTAQEGLMRRLRPS